MDERELALRRARVQTEIDTYLQTPDTPEIRLLLDIATLKREIIDLNIKINDIKIELLQTTNADERARKEAEIERKEADIERKKAEIKNAILEKEIIDLNIKINDIKIELLQTINADERARKEADIERKEAKIERKEAEIVLNKQLLLKLPSAPPGPSFEQIISLSFASFIFSFYSSTSPMSLTRSSSSKR
jgi:hypothetical protein